MYQNIHTEWLSARHAWVGCCIAGMALMAARGGAGPLPGFCGAPQPVTDIRPTDNATAVPTVTHLEWGGNDARRAEIVPEAYAGQHAPQPVGYPWAAAGRYQQIYDGSLFKRAGRITGIRLRRSDMGDDEMSGTLTVTIRLGYSARALDSFTHVFADNIDEPSLTMVSSQGGATLRGRRDGNPVSFNTVLPFEYPFDYNPAIGPLLLDVTVNSGTGTAIFFDGVRDAGMRRVYITTNEGGGPDSLEGTEDNLGIVTEFLFDGAGETASPVRFGVVQITGNGTSQNPVQTALDRINRIEGTTASSLSWSDAVGMSGQNLRRGYDVIVCPGDLSPADYNSLRSAVASGGLQQFAELGGVLALIVSGNQGDQADIAPGGVDYTEAFAQAVTIQLPQHPFVTGSQMEGAAMTDARLENWGSSAHGFLENIPSMFANAIVAPEGSASTTLAEYRVGQGHVIVTGMTMGWNLGVSGEGTTMGSAFTNLLRLARLRARPAVIGVLDNEGSTPAPNATEQALTTLSHMCGYRGELLPWSQIIPSTGPTLRLRFDSIFFPGDPSSADHDNLTEAVGGQGVLNQYVRLGGNLLVVASGSRGDRLVGPGTLVLQNFGATHDAVTITNSSNYYIAGSINEGATLVEGDFQAWGASAQGYFEPGLTPAGADVVMANSLGGSFVEYGYESGSVAATTLTIGWPGIGDEHLGPVFENFLRLGGLKGRRGVCPTNYQIAFGPEPAPSYVAHNNFGNRFDPGILNSATRYYLQVNPQRQQFSGSIGSITSFLTLSVGRPLGDFDDSGCTNITDFLFMLDNWQMVSSLGNPAIGIEDFLALLDNWQQGPTCP